MNFTVTRSSLHCQCLNQVQQISFLLVKLKIRIITLFKNKFGLEITFILEELFFIS